MEAKWKKVLGQEMQRKQNRIKQEIKRIQSRKDRLERIRNGKENKEEDI